MRTILMTLAEDLASTTSDHFAVKFSVDEEDCFSFSRALQGRGYDVYFVNWKDLELGEFQRMFHDNEKRVVVPREIDDFDLVFIYKMEGFLLDHPRFLRMLERFEEAPALVVNDPATIRHNTNKRYLLDLERNGIRIPPTPRSYRRHRGRHRLRAANYRLLRGRAFEVWTEAVAA